MEAVRPFFFAQKVYVHFLATKGFSQYGAKSAKSAKRKDASVDHGNIGRNVNEEPVWIVGCLANRFTPS